MKQKEQSEREAVESLRSGTLQEKEVLKMLYAKHYPEVERYVLNNKGDVDSAKDVFQEGMIILYRNIKRGKFRAESSIGTYLNSICRFIWLKTLKRKPDERSLENCDTDSFERPLGALLDKERKNMILEIFSKLGARCREILVLTFYEGLEMKEIASRTGFKDEQNVRNKKYKCMKSLKELISADPNIGTSIREMIP